MKWVEALKIYNTGKSWCVPKKGSPEHAEVMKIMNRTKPEEVEKRNVERREKSLEQLKALDTRAKIEERRAEKPATKKQEFEQLRQQRINIGQEITTLEKTHGKVTFHEAMEDRRRIRNVEGIPANIEKQIDGLKENNRLLLLRQDALVDAYIKETYGDRKITNKDITDLGETKWDMEVKQRLEKMRTKQQSAARDEAKSKKKEEDWTQMSAKELRTLISEHLAKDNKRLTNLNITKKDKLIELVRKYKIRD